MKKLIVWSCLLLSRLKDAYLETRNGQLGVVLQE